MRIIVYIFMFILGALPLKAQHMTNLFENIDKDTAVYNFEMPELRYLIEAAHEYHAYHRMQDAQMRNFVSQIEAKKREWMDHFYIDADVRYGLYNYIFLGNDNQAAPGIAPVDNQFSYYVAFSVRIPFSVFSKTKHEIRAFEHTIDQHKAYQEQLNDELTRIVIEEYYLMLTFKEQMISFQDVMQTLRAMYLKVLRDFERGYVTMEDVRVVAEAKAKAETDFYKAKNEFFMHTEKLMAMTGYKLKPVER